MCVTPHQQQEEEDSSTPFFLWNWLAGASGNTLTSCSCPSMTIQPPQHRLYRRSILGCTHLSSLAVLSNSGWIYIFCQLFWGERLRGKKNYYCDDNKEGIWYFFFFFFHVKIEEIILTWSERWSRVNEAQRRFCVSKTSFVQAPSLTFRMAAARWRISTIRTCKNGLSIFLLLIGKRNFKKPAHSAGSKTRWKVQIQLASGRRHPSSSNNNHHMIQ